jgi:hypothetical protein
MRKLLFALAAGSAMIIAAPAPSHAGSGVGVEVGPGGIAIGPRRDRYFDDDCRVIKERIVRPNGRVVVRTREVCD